MFGQVCGQELQELQKAVCAGRPGLIDDTHPSAAELFDDVVMRDGLANHWSKILWLQ